MVKTGKPVNARLKYPDYFWPVMKEIRTIPILSRIHFINNECLQIQRGQYISVKRIVEYIIAADYNKKCLEAARDAMIYISPHKLTDEPFERLNFEKTTNPFYLGVLFETLPEPIAVQLFWKRYAFDREGSLTEARNNAMKTLLRFSQPLKAAPFILALHNINPQETSEIVQEMLLSTSIAKYKFRRYEVKYLLMELPNGVFPGINKKAKKLPEPSFPVIAYRTIPEERIAPKKPASKRKIRKKKTRKEIKAKKSKTSEAPLKNHLAAIQEHADSIKGGSQEVVWRILKRVISADYDPRIMAAAREALAPITTYDRDRNDWLFKTYGSKFHDVPFHLGVLFELFPRETAVQIFKMEFLRSGKLDKRAFLRAGQGFLRFSTPKEAAKFIKVLGEKTGINIKCLLQRFLKNYEVCGYQSRRYEAEDLLSAFENL